MIFDELIKKASVVSKKITNETYAPIRICSEEWEKTNKKPEIVDLWYQLEKDKCDNNRNVRDFDFNEAYNDGVSFYVHNSIGMEATIIKKLKDLGVKIEGQNV